MPIGCLDINKLNLNKDGEENQNSTTELSKDDGKSGGDDGYDKKNGKIMQRKYEKRDAVSFILLIKKIQILAASYFNGTIILWDTLLMEQRKIYKDHKTVKKLQKIDFIKFFFNN